MRELEYLKEQVAAYESVGADEALALARSFGLTLKQLLVYSGPETTLQEASYVALSRILGYYVEDVHREIIRHQNLTQFGERNADLTLVFRGVGKSTIGNVVRAIGYILRDPNVRIGEGSDTATAAHGFHATIVSLLKTNQCLIGLFGQFIGGDAKQNTTETTILQRTDPTIHNATITSLGIGSQAASRHFDVFFGDDLVTLELSRTVTQRENLQAWHGSTLVGTFLSHTKRHYIGTRYYQDDFWDVAIKGREGRRGILADSLLSIPMVRTDAEGHWLEPTFPKLYPLSVCEERRATMGRYHFNAQMQQDTSGGEGLVFNYSDFRWYNDTENPLPASGRVFSYSDLAAKRTDLGDFHVTITIKLAKLATGQWGAWVVDIIRKRAGTEEQREIVKASCARWRPVLHGVEANAAQGGLAQEVQDRSLYPIYPDNVEKDKVYRAMRVANVVETHRLFLPMPDTPLGRLCEPLVDELTRFDGDPKNRDDCVDALVGALTLAIYGGYLDSSAQAGVLGEKMETV